MIDFGKIEAFPESGESILISLVITVKLVINAKSQSQINAGCSETCSNKCRVSNKRRSDRSALDAGGGFCQQHLTTIHAR